VNTVLEQKPDSLPMTKACHALALNRSTLYARRHCAANHAPVNRSRQHAVQPRALSAQERATVIDTLHSEDYCDQPPAEVYQSLLEQQRYLCSVSTMHRLLKSVQGTGERFVKGRPTVPMPPTSVAINPIQPDEDGVIIDVRVNFPTLTAAGYVKSMLSLK